MCHSHTWIKHPTQRSILRGQPMGEMMQSKKTKNKNKNKQTPALCEELRIIWDIRTRKGTCSQLHSSLSVSPQLLSNTNRLCKLSRNITQARQMHLPSNLQCPCVACSETWGSDPVTLLPIAPYFICLPTLCLHTLPFVLNLHLSNQVPAL
jgi:hypothetical protein